MAAAGTSAVRAPAAAVARRLSCPAYLTKLHVTRALAGSVLPVAARDVGTASGPPCEQRSASGGSSGSGLAAAPTTATTAITTTTVPPTPPRGAGGEVSGVVADINTPTTSAHAAAAAAAAAPAFRTTAWLVDAGATRAWGVTYEGFTTASQRHTRLSGGWPAVVADLGLRVGE
jgi:hypothetical protein